MFSRTFDPDNRLVADSLEADWNNKLRALTEAHEEYARRREQDARVLTDDQRAAILALASDFPRLWRDLATPDRERKRMVRLLLEDVTLSRNHQLTLQIRFKGGAHKTLNLPSPLQSWQKWVTPSAVVNEIDQLLNNHTVAQIAAILNERGIISGAGRSFHPHLVARLVRSYGLKPRYDRLREAGLLTLQEMANALQISPCHVKVCGPGKRPSAESKKSRSTVSSPIFACNSRIAHQVFSRDQQYRLYRRTFGR